MNYVQKKVLTRSWKEVFFSEKDDQPQFWKKKVLKKNEDKRLELYWANFTSGPNSTGPSHHVVNTANYSAVRILVGGCYAPLLAGAIRSRLGAAFGWAEPIRPNR
jgi:hypothetical protein